MLSLHCCTMFRPEHHLHQEQKALPLRLRLRFCLFDSLTHGYDREVNMNGAHISCVCMITQSTSRMHVNPLHGPSKDQWAVVWQICTHVVGIKVGE